MESVISLSPDPFVQTPEVAGLDTCTFYQFLNNKNVTMVMFYDPKLSKCRAAAPDFALNLRPSIQATCFIWSFVAAEQEIDSATS
ncbi:unnamed protein product, partial [Candidula unifasciata]